MKYPKEVMHKLFRKMKFENINKNEHYYVLQLCITYSQFFVINKYSICDDTIENKVMNLINLTKMQEVLM